MIKMEEPSGKGRVGEQQWMGKSQEAVTALSEGAVPCHINLKSQCSFSASCFCSKQKQLDETAQLTNPTKYSSSCKKCHVFHFRNSSPYICTCTTFGMKQELLQDLEAKGKKAGKQMRVTRGTMGAA